MKKVFFALALIFLGLILYNPQICLESAKSGLILCGRVIIPSLYPFTFCVVFILKSGVLDSIKFKQKILGLDSQMLSIFLLSLIGGYPLGAKMLNDSKIDSKNASVMLNYCVNAGPAFIILAVGNGVFSSREIGFLLFFAHLFPSVVLAFLFRKKIKITTENTNENRQNIIDTFVLSASDAASALINICSFVILFSVICAYINLFPFLKPLSLILEISNTISTTRNIYLISAFLGFGCLCVWCQVFALSKGLKLNLPLFILCRFFHAVLSALLTYLLLKIFAPTIPTISNGIAFTSSLFAQSGSVGISLIITGLVLIISLSSKNFAGNMLDDIV